MNKYYTIKSTETIGDSLSTVNLNYLNLEVDTLSIQASANSLLTPIENYYNYIFDFVKNAATISQSISASVINSTTVVQKNSSKWIKPITILYPTVVSSSSVSTMVSEISSWVATNFPVFGAGTKAPDIKPSNFPNYVEGQTLTVYAHTWSLGSDINETVLLRDYTKCASQSADVCVTCYVYFTGGTYCGTNTWVACDQTKTVTCPTCKLLQTSFLNPPYATINSGSSRFGPISNTRDGYGYIEAKVNMQFKDRYENNSLYAYMFEIKNCRWVLSRVLT